MNLQTDLFGNETVVIPMDKKRETGLFSLISKEDLSNIRNYNWHSHKDKVGRIYARTNVWSKKKTRRNGILMHRMIMNPPKDMEIDHINGNCLDNRRCNLRICTKTQNQQNRVKRKNRSSKFKGVSLYKSCKPGIWKAQIKWKNRKYHLGYFDCEEDAAIVYDVAAQLFFGKFSNINFPIKNANTK